MVMIYSCESWARSTTEVDFYGCIYWGGSARAGDYLFGMEYINRNSDVQTVYDAEQLGGWWTRYISEVAYDTAFASLGGYEPATDLVRYTINGEDYCVLYEIENTWESRYFVELCEQEGIRFVSEEEMDILISRRMAELGVEETWKSGNGVHWNYWYNY